MKLFLLTYYYELRYTNDTKIYTKIMCMLVVVSVGLNINIIVFKMYDELYYERNFEKFK